MRRTPAAPTDPNASNNSATRSLTVQPDGVDLSITKNKSPSYVALGSNITSTIVVANAGPRSPASGTITVTDALDPTREQFVSFAGTNWSCTSTPPNVVCTYNAALGIASTSALTITTQSLSAGVATNNATASYSGTPGDYNSANDTIGASVTVTAANQSPDLQVALSATTAGGTQTTVEVNETSITYTATLTNKPTGTAADAQGVTVTLSIPGRTTATTVSAGSIVLTNASGNSNAAFTCSGTGSGSTGNVVCVQTGGTVLAPGDVVTFTVTANRPMLDVTNVNATVSAVAAAQGDPDASNNQASVPITIAPIADIELVSKVLAANPVLAGTSATYTITVRNNGPSAAAGVQMADVFVVPNGDAGFTFLSAVASNGGTCSGLTANASYTTTPTPTLTCSWAAAVPSGSTRTVTVVVRPNWQAGAAARTLDNTAIANTTTAEDSFGSQGTAANSKSLTLNINPAQVDVLVNNTDSPDPLGYDPGVPTNNDVTYNVGVTNSGPSLATGTGFTFTMTPPAGKTITFRGDGPASNVAATNPTGTIAGSVCDQVGNSVTGPSTLTVTCSFTAPGQLAAGATATRYLVFRVASPPTTGGDVYNTNATVLVNETDSNAANNSEGEQTTVRARADLSITKTPSLSTVQIRQPFGWTIAVVNNGPGDSQTTGLADTLPTGMAYTGTPTYAISGGGATGSCSVAGQTMTCAFGVLVAGRTATVSVPVRMTAYPAGGTSQNCATATTSEVDPNSANNLSICSTVTVQRSSLAGTVFQDRDRAGANAGTPQPAASEPRIAGVAIALAGTDAYGNAVSLTTTSDGSGRLCVLRPVAGRRQRLHRHRDATRGLRELAGLAADAGRDRQLRARRRRRQHRLVADRARRQHRGHRLGLPRGATADAVGLRLRRQQRQRAVRDAGTDAAAPNATVRLLDASTLAVVATTTADGTGAYSFTGLDPVHELHARGAAARVSGRLGNGPVNPGRIGGAACATGCTAQPNTPSAGTDRIASIDLSAGVDGTAFDFGELQQTTVLRPRLRRRQPQRHARRWRDRAPRGRDRAPRAGRGLHERHDTADDDHDRRRYVVVRERDGGAELPRVRDPAGRLRHGQRERHAEQQRDRDREPADRGLAEQPLRRDARRALRLGLSGLLGGDAGEQRQRRARRGASSASSTCRSRSRAPTSRARRCRARRSPTRAATGASPTCRRATRPATRSSKARFRRRRAATSTAATARATLGGSAAVNDRVSGIVVPAGGTGTGYGFGELPIAPISGTVYLDRNRNNALDATPTDGRIAGVTVRLVQGASCAAGTTVQSTTTAADGGWAFSGAVAGQNYLVCETQPAGYGDGATTPGSGNTTPAANTIAIVNLPAAGSSGNLFGERAGTVSGFVFLDANNDGARTGDVGIAGVVVALSGVDAAGNAVSRTATTDGSGAYAFADVLGAGAGGYTLAEQPAQPVVAGRTTLNGRTVAGPAGGNATAPATTPSAIASIALAAGADSAENDFAEILPVGPRRRGVHRPQQQRRAERTRRRRPRERHAHGDRQRRHRRRRVAHGHDRVRRHLVDRRPAPRHLHRDRADPAAGHEQRPDARRQRRRQRDAAGDAALGGIGHRADDAGHERHGLQLRRDPELQLDRRPRLPRREQRRRRRHRRDRHRRRARRAHRHRRRWRRRVANDDDRRAGKLELREPAARHLHRARGGAAGGHADGRTTAGPAAAPRRRLRRRRARSPASCSRSARRPPATCFGELTGASIAGRVIADANNNGRLDAGEGGLANVTLVLTGSDDLGRP